MNKEKIIKYIEHLEGEAKDCNKYFMQRNELFIENQKIQQENKELKEKILMYEKTQTFADYVNTVNELIKLKDNWNMLKEYVISQIERSWEADVQIYEDVFSKMLELEKGDSNE